jgi:hypothetical protein
MGKVVWLPERSTCLGVWPENREINTSGSHVNQHVYMITLMYIRHSWKNQKFIRKFSEVLIACGLPAGLVVLCCSRCPQMLSMEASPRFLDGRWIGDWFLDLGRLEQSLADLGGNLLAGLISQLCWRVACVLPRSMHAYMVRSRGTICWPDRHVATEVHAWSVLASSRGSTCRLA